MDKVQQDEWYNLRNRATQLVRQGNRPKGVGVERLFQILVLPALYPSVGWEVYRMASRSSPERYAVVHTCWQMREDQRKFATPVERLRYPRVVHPTIETSSFEIAGSVVESFLDTLKSIRHPAYIAKDCFGIDGTTYEFSFGEHYFRAQYVWWEHPPAGWKEMGDAVEDFLNKLEDLRSRQTRQE